MFSVKSCKLAQDTLFDCKFSSKLRDVIVCFCTESISRNHYEALRIPRNSTQTDIKAAYYELSKTYHPDRNQGSDSAAKKFREITRAYEVLSNYRSRKLYDKGIIQDSGDMMSQQYSQKVRHHDVNVQDDAQTKFYKSRFKMSSVSDAKGNIPIYNFDEWTKMHYGNTFQRRQNAKNRWNIQQTLKKQGAAAFQFELLVSGIFGILTMIYLYNRAHESFDVVQEEKSKDDGTQATDE